MDEVHWLAPIPNNWNGFCRDQWIYVLCCLSPQLVFYRGILCTSIEEPLPWKWASRALKYLHSEFKPWTPPPPSPNYGGNRNISTVVAVSSQWLVTRTRAGQWTAVQGHVKLLGSMFCIYFTWLYTPVVTLLCVLLSYSHKDTSKWSLHHNWIQASSCYEGTHRTKFRWAIASIVYVYISILSMLCAWSDDADAEWSRDSAAAICNVSSPSQCPVCPGPGSHYRSLLSSAPRHSFSRHILDCGGGQGMVTGQVTGTTHCM